VTITLKGVSEKDTNGDPITSALSVEIDEAAATGLVQGFVTAYNAVVDAIRQVANYNASTRQASTLFGDSTVRGLQSSLRGELGRAVSGVASGVGSLAEIGIRTGSDGKLSIDATKLETALGSNLPGVANLFSADDGYAKRLDELISAYVDSDGLIEARTDGLTDRVKDINKQRNELDRRMQTLQARLLKQYTAMDALVGQLQSTGTYLTQQISALEKQTSQ
jgi:flagellar hook-associated protein 2